MESDESTPLIAIIGETASGKSALALELAGQFNGELVCADSWTVYKGFDIGTSKPSLTDLLQVQHHILDVADPTTGFNAVEFQRLAQAAIADIQQRGKLPIIVGGTGLYVDSILYNYQFLPAPKSEQREELNELSLEELQQKVHDLKLNTDGIDMRNKRRIVRLIENEGVRPTKKGLRPHTLVLGIAVNREHLRQRITERVDAMLAAGLEQEVSQLAQRYGWDVEPMKGIGYREWQPYFAGEQSLEQTRERIIAATMGLAKRQRTWFKRNDCIQWLSELSTKAKAVALVTTFLDHNS